MRQFYEWYKIKMDETERFAHMSGKPIGLVRRWCDIKDGLVAA